MTSENENQLTRRDSQAPILRPGNTLETALGHMTADQRTRLVAKATEARVRLDEAEMAADQRDRNSTRDSIKVVQMARALDQMTKSDHTIKATMETASGQTNIEVKRNNNLVIIVVAVVIGAVFLVLFSRK